MMSACDDIISEISEKFVTFSYRSHYVTSVTGVPNVTDVPGVTSNSFSNSEKMPEMPKISTTGMWP
jgi:hypothetical protein